MTSREAKGIVFDRPIVALSVTVFVGPFQGTRVCVCVVACVYVLSSCTCVVVCSCAYAHRIHE